jgi:hypothetical protein
MYGLEYASFIFDVICGFVCTLLSFLRYLNIGKGTEKNTGLVGLITGVVGFVLTFLYFVYSAYIFTKDTYVSNISTMSGAITKKFPNGAIYKIDGTRPYLNDKGDDAQYIKYYELGQKQYNYDKEKEFPKDNSEFDNCRSRTENNSTSLSYPYPSYCSNNGFIISSQLSYKNNKGKKCKYLFYDQSYGFDYKYKYDNWVTTLVVSNFIMACNIGLSIFGYLLFISDNGGYIKIQNDNMNFML